MPVTGMIPRFMPTLTRIWNRSIAAIPAGDQGPVQVLRERQDAQRSPDKQGVEGQDERGSREAEALTDHSEDEVGVPLREELELGLGRLVAAADLAAGSNRDDALIDLIARSAGSSLGLQEAGQPVLLVVHAGSAPPAAGATTRAKRDGDRRQTADRREVRPAHPGEEENRECDDHEHDSRAEVGLKED